jgi:hypothetical protein
MISELYGAKYDSEFIVLNYLLFGTKCSEYGSMDFLLWLLQNENFKNHKIVINQSSEPLSNAGKQSNQNLYYNTYYRISELLKNREVYFISDMFSSDFDDWVKNTYGWKHIPYHFHFDVYHTLSHYTNVPLNKNKNSFKKKIITVNGNMQNEHKPKIQEMFTQLNVWDISYWSFDDISNFGMDIYKDRYDLNRIYLNLIPLFDNSFLHIVSETVSDNYFLNTNIRMDFMSKVGRALVLQNPFVVVGNCGVLKELHRIGFKTFSDFWDESYDDVEELNDRMLLIKNLIKLIKDKTFDQQLEMMEQMFPIFEHNRKTIIALSKSERKNIENIIPNFFNNNNYKTFDYKKSKSIL